MIIFNWSFLTLVSLSTAMCMKLSTVLFCSCSTHLTRLLHSSVIMCPSATLLSRKILFSYSFVCFFNYELHDLLLYAVPIRSDYDCSHNIVCPSFSHIIEHKFVTFCFLLFSSKSSTFNHAVDFKYMFSFFALDTRLYRLPKRIVWNFLVLHCGIGCLS